MKIAELARVLGVTRKTIKDWESKPEFMACFDDKKELDVIKLLQFLYLWKVQTEKEVVALSSKELKTFYDAKRSELIYREQIGELVPKAEYLETEKERLHTIRHNILDLPNKLAIELNLEEIQKKLVYNSCRNILMSIKDTFEGKEEIWTEFINGAMPNDR